MLKLTTYLVYKIVSVPLQLPSIWQDLMTLPLSSWPPSHVKVQESPRLGCPSSPSEQSISPLSGAVSGGQAINIMKNTVRLVMNQWKFKWDSGGT